MGNKFIPNYFFSKKDYFNYLLSIVDNSLLKLNSNLYINKNKNQNTNSRIYNSSDKTMNEFKIDNKYFETIYTSFRKNNKKSTNKMFLENEKIFISKEIDEIRSNVHSQLISEYEKIKIKPNISFTQLKYLIKFQKEKNFKIINCDKNVGNAMLSNELYRTSAIEFLEKDNTFSKLTENPLYTTVNFIREEINNLCLNGHISEKLGKYLTSNITESKLGSFRLLAKLHKPKFSWRPIVNCKNHPNSKICLILDLLLKPIIMKTETYIKDSQNLIQKIKDMKFENKPFLYSLDIVSLYTNIIQNHATQLITEFMNKYLDSFHINIVALNKLIKIMFGTNVFKFEESFYRQIQGLPMGCICGPSIANLYVYILEIKWYHIEKPLVYFRFIDDTIMALKYKLNFQKYQDSFIYLKFTENSGDEINFLDLNISFNKITKKLDFSVHIKPTNSFDYLRKNSNHPGHIFSNIPKSIFIRNRRICSYYSDYVIVSNMHINQLINRGYEKNSLIRLCKSIGNVDRNSLLPYKEKINNFFSNETKNFIYLDIFNYNLNIKSIVYKHFKNIFANYNFKLNYIYKNNCNLNNAFVHNSKINITKKCKTKKCLEKNCKICKYIYAKDYFKLDKNSNVKMKLMNNASCLTKNIIYIIICKRCSMLYVGESCKSLRDRATQHINHITKFIPYEKYENKEVARHFRSKKHKLSDFKICVFRSDLEEIEKRKNLELDLISRLNTNKKRCINKITSKRSKKFIFNC